MLSGPVQKDSSHMRLMDYSRPWLAALIASLASVCLIAARGNCARMMRPSRWRMPRRSSPSTRPPILSSPANSHSRISAFVKDVLVKDGDVIKKGDVLLRQDDDLDLNEVEQLRLQAESNTKIEAAEADLKAKKAAFERKQEIFNKDYGSKSELEEAEAEFINRQKQLQQAREDKQVAQLKYEQQKIKIEKMKLRAPFDGAVQRVIAQAGRIDQPAEHRRRDRGGEQQSAEDRHSQVHHAAGISFEDRRQAAGAVRQ